MRSAGDQDAFVQTWAGLGNRSCCQVEVDVVCDEEVEAAVAVIVDEGTARIPALAVADYSGFLTYIGEGAVPIVVIENVLAEISDEQVVPAIVVVVADAASLSPARVRDAGFQGNVGKRAVPIVAEQMRGGLTAFGKTFKARAVDQENIEPAVVVVVVKGDAAARGFEQIFVFVLAAENGLCIQTGFAAHIDEDHSVIG